MVHVGSLHDDRLTSAFTRRPSAAGDAARWRGRFAPRHRGRQKVASCRLPGRLERRFAMVRGAAATLCVLALGTASGVATAGEIKVLSAGGVKPVMTGLVPQCERASGHKVRIDDGAVGALVGRVQQGEAADVVVVSGPQMDVLEK